MKFKGFEIVSDVFVRNAYCKCGHQCIEVPNEIFYSALYCPSCESVYQIKMIKIEKKRLNNAFLQQCRDENA